MDRASKNAPASSSGGARSERRTARRRSPELPRRPGLLTLPGREERDLRADPILTRRAVRGMALRVADAEPLIAAAYDTPSLAALMHRLSDAWRQVPERDDPM